MTRAGPIPTWARATVYLVGGLLVGVVALSPVVDAVRRVPRLGAVGLLPTPAAQAAAVALAVMLACAVVVVVVAMVGVTPSRHPTPAPRVIVREVTRDVVREVVREVDREVRTVEPMRPEREETDVYRLLDRTGRLLYVGIGTTAAARWTDHARHQQWWPDVASHDTVRYPFRGQALAVEQSAIEHEKPVHNRHRGSLNDASWMHGWNQPRRVLAQLPAARVTEEPM